MYEIRYNFEQLEKAAEFIFDNNTTCSRWPTPAYNVYDVRIQIEDMIRKIAAQNMAWPPKKRNKKWISWTGTGGYFLVFMSDDDYSIDVDIYVDPAIGEDVYRHMTEVID